MPISRAKPRKSPKQARSLETVDAIVEAAARILEELGHRGFSTNAVADRAGVSIGSLYQYFPSKDALIGTLIERETSVLMARAEAALLSSSGEVAMRTLIAACVEHQLGRPELARLLDVEESRMPGDSHQQRVFESFRDIVSRMLTRSDLPPQRDAAMAARDVVAMLKGIVDAAGQHGESDAEALSRRVERAIFGYLTSLAI